MKKSYFLLMIAIVATLITTQSFRYDKKKKVTYDPRNHFSLKSVAMCGTMEWNENNTNLNIPALKGWGTYHWKISTSSDSAQYYFDQGISMYYAFHSIEAIASFEKAIRLDPSCAMAWYGKALAMGPTVNHEITYEAPLAALQAARKSKELLPTLSTSFEQDLIEAIQIRYGLDTSITVMQRRQYYADAMEQVYRRHKNNADALTLYADALLLLHPWDLYEHDLTPKTWTPAIRSLLEEAMALSPKHPGANHYYIHTLEGSGQPETALKSAYLLDTLMPQVAHMTHMPSHIYIRTGHYQRGIQVNDAAIAGFNQYQKSYPPVAGGKPMYVSHALHMKSACAQMAGNFSIAIEAAKEVQEQIAPLCIATTNTALGNFLQYMHATPTLTYVRFGKWDEILNLSKTDTLQFSDALLHFAKGIAFSRTHRIDLAKKELSQLQEEMKTESFKRDEINYSTAFNICRVAELILQGIIHEESKDYMSAITSFREAVEAEDRLLYSEPRSWILPSRQFLGAVLIKSKNYRAATTALLQDLKINPNNGWSLTGLKTVYQKIDNNTALKKATNELTGAWRLNDTEINSPVL